MFRLTLKYIPILKFSLHKDNKVREQDSIVYLYYALLSKGRRYWSSYLNK